MSTQTTHQAPGLESGDNSPRQFSPEVNIAKVASNAMFDDAYTRTNSNTNNDNSHKNPGSANCEHLPGLSISDKPKPNPIQPPAHDCEPPQNPGKPPSNPGRPPELGGIHPPEHVLPFAPPERPVVPPFNNRPGNPGEHNHLPPHQRNPLYPGDENQPPTDRIPGDRSKYEPTSAGKNNAAAEKPGKPDKQENPDKPVKPTDPNPGEAEPPATKPQRPHVPPRPHPNRPVLGLGISRMSIW
ncbi:MAG: hypothetical protein JST16_07650 [Bdellovibrionales bacterium]|nr:hypothetical protein [Bdellovibrionales bacterium]